MSVDTNDNKVQVLYKLGSQCDIMIDNSFLIESVTNFRIKNADSMEPLQFTVEVDSVVMTALYYGDGIIARIKEYGTDKLISQHTFCNWRLFGVFYEMMQRGEVYD